MAQVDLVDLWEAHTAAEFETRDVDAETDGSDEREPDELTAETHGAPRGRRVAAPTEKLPNE